MRFTIRTRLSAAFLLVGIVSVVVAGLIIDRTVRRVAFEQIEERLQYEVTMTGQMMASALFAPLTPEDTSLQAPVHDLADAVRTHLSVLTPQGMVAADSERSSPDPVSEAGAPEVVALSHSRKSSAVRGEGDDRRLWVAEAVVRDGRTLGIARASVPMAVVQAQVIAVRERVVLSALAALLLGSIVGIGLSLGISRPIDRLAAAARRIGRGDLDVRVDESSRDEIGELGKALNDMSASLKDMILRLDLRNQDMRRVLDTIAQGLVVVALDGAIEEERSIRIDEWFERPPKGTRIWKLFEETGPNAAEAVELGWQQLVDGFLPLEVAFLQLPQRLAYRGKTLHLAYAPIAGKGDVCERVLVVVSDVSAAVEAERKELDQKDLLAILGNSMRDRGAVLDFLQETDVLAARITVRAPLVHLKRDLHTLKGNCAIMGVLGIASLCDEIETRVEYSGELDESSAVRMGARWKSFRENVDVFIGAKAGIVLDQGEITEVIHAIMSDEPRELILERMASWMLGPVEGPLKTLAERAQELALRLGKGTIRISLEHDGTRLERERWAPLFSGLVHVVRNAVDHGLESPDERQRAGKPAQGTLGLRARNVGGHFVVEISDDGRGVQWPLLADKLLALGLPAGTREDLVEGLFLDGISTVEYPNEISGRGIGMAALREAVRRLDGEVEIATVDGQGTTVTCRFPMVTSEAKRILRSESMRPGARSPLVSGSSAVQHASRVEAPAP